MPPKDLMPTIAVRNAIIIYMKQSGGNVRSTSCAYWLVPTGQRLALDSWPVAKLQWPSPRAWL